MTFSYSIYGLIFHLPFPCPFLPRVTEDSLPDVTVRYGTVPEQLVEMPSSEKEAKRHNWQVLPGRYLYVGGMRAGRFLVEDGRQVTIELNHAAEDNRILHLFLRYGIAAIMRQRGHLVLHANAAVTKTGAAVISGKRGTGKSTTLISLLNRGCPMLTDDVTVLAMGSQGLVEVLPGISCLQLCDETAEILGLDVSESFRNPLGRSKLVLSAQGKLNSKPVPLRSLYILETSPEHSNVTISRITGKGKFEALLGCVYFPLMIEEHPGLFSLFSAAAEQAEIIRIRRPEGRWTVDEVVKAVLDG
jgi:hypothetical protein